jgi:hypothetical protein
MQSNKIIAAGQTCYVENLFKIYIYFIFIIISEHDIRWSSILSGKDDFFQLFN